MKISRPAKSADGSNFAAKYGWNLVKVAVRQFAESISPAALCACISRLAIQPVKPSHARTHVLDQRQL